MKKRATQKRTVMITASTKLTMIFCACTVGLALLLFLFLILFPIKVDNPKNGINEKLIASATTAPMVTTTTTATQTTEGFSNTRQTTDRNRVTTAATRTETLWEAQNYDDSDYDNSNIYNNDNLYNDYSDFNNNNSNNNYNDYTPVQTEPPAIVTDAPIPDEQPDTGGDIIDVPAVTEIVPEVQDEF